jgi:hypothetical protein
MLAAIQLPQKLAALATEAVRKYLMPKNVRCFK